MGASPSASIAQQMKRSRPSGPAGHESRGRRAERIGERDRLVAKHEQIVVAEAAEGARGRRRVPPDGCGHRRDGHRPSAVGEEPQDGLHDRTLTGGAARRCAGGRVDVDERRGGGEGKRRVAPHAPSRPTIVRSTSGGTAIVTPARSSSSSM